MGRVVQTASTRTALRGAQWGGRKAPRHQEGSEFGARVLCVRTRRGTERWSRRPVRFLQVGQIGPLSTEQPYLRIYPVKRPFYRSHMAEGVRYLTYITVLYSYVAGRYLHTFLGTDLCIYRSPVGVFSKSKQIWRASHGFTMKLKQEGMVSWELFLWWT